ncbi:relaxase/mobilization nuclease domain-containing protein (plasmid) [Mesorhizobium loti]|nr:relaxase/mobilization nuclease domain-containing protein [Mesorhizobium loti]
MSRAAQIGWWLEQVNAARRAVETAREERGRPRVSRPIDEERQPKAKRVSSLPSTSSQADIRGATISGGQDEERRRLLPAAARGGAGGLAGNTGSGSPTAPIAGNLSSSGGAQGGGAIGRARQLAAGYQPAVIKVVSYARGVARVTATGQYVQREEAALETHDGRMLGDREAVADEIKVWSTSFAKRAESQDVAAMRLKLHGVRDTPAGRQTYEKAMVAGFEGHRYAYRLDATPSGELEARLVVAMAGSPKERLRVREERVGNAEVGFTQRRLNIRSEATVKARIEAATGHPRHAVSVDPGPTTHGRDGVTYRLNKLIEKGAVVDDRGKVLSNVADARVAAREWGPSLRSQSARDTMHLIISAKTGADVAALTDAVRAFLHDRFADHKFMFGVHTDKQADGHIHAHAIITVRNESGQKIHPGRETFREWREVYAQHAQAHGLKIVATSAKERASSQSYGPKDKAIVDVAERPRPTREARDRAYAADPANQRLIHNARNRIRVARANPIKLPASKPDRRAVNESVAAWRTLAREHPDNALAKQMFERLAMAQTLGNVLDMIGKRVDHFTKETNDMPVTSAQMTKDLRLMNEAVSRTSDLLDGETKQQFREASSRYLETLASRIDLQRAQERGAQEVSRSEVEAIAGVNADRLIARAQQVSLKEQREAVSAERIVDRAVEMERRQEARGGIDPASHRELGVDRAIVANSQQSAAREAREAAAAIEASRVLADHPAQPLPQSLLQTDAIVALQLEQEKVLQEIDADKAEVQATKGQRIS